MKSGLNQGAAWLVTCVLGIAGVGSGEAADPAEDRASGFTYPQQREVEGYTLVIHAPQIRQWPEFKAFEATVVVELTAPDVAEASYGIATVTGGTDVDLTNRIVEVRSPRVEGVSFRGEVPSGYADVVKQAVTRTRFEAPLDLFLAYLAEDVLSEPPPEGFNSSPPPIVVRDAPTILLFVNGEPVAAKVSDTGLEMIVNANWPTFRERDGAYYLLDRKRWLTSAQLQKGWRAAEALPGGFSGLPEAPEYEAAREAVPLVNSGRPVPEVVYATQPTELIVTDGPAELKAVAETEGLRYVSNTETPLFELDGIWYFLAAGRWFAAANLKAGPWTYAAELPAAFAEIPEDHPTAAVRASVPGTVEARMAALEASIPERKVLDKREALGVEVTYAGDPQFEAVEGSGVERGVNTGFDVFRYEGVYYLCYSAGWYVSASAGGPWKVADAVPPAIYLIPPESPSYHVTQVAAAESTENTVTYEFTPAYTTSVYVVYGVPYYGTGWYYPPYVWGPYYYPYWGSYGHGVWYNPATGGYGSRSVWYGPYGGYSYSRGYNPSTGRYGYVETAWDGDEWASHGATYNPRTGIATETSRYYDADNNEMTRQRTISGEELTVQTTTTRQDGRSVTTMEGSGGGQGISVSGEGPGRTTVVQSGSGDLYAGHDGNVYKKTEEGWQHYGDGGWSDVETPEPRDGARETAAAGSEAAGERRAAGVESAPRGEPVDFSRELEAASLRPDHGARGEATSWNGGGYGGRYGDRGRLDRDYAARQRGQAHFQQRRGGFSAGQRGFRGGFRGRR